MASRPRLLHDIIASVVAVVLAVPACASADDLLDEWVVCYDGPGEEPYAGDRAWGMARDQDGNLYVAGATYGGGSLDDYITIKYDPYGNQLWIATYNGPANASDNAQAIAVDLDGNAYVTGMSDGIGTSYDYATVKYDADGHEEWVARYDGGAYDPDRAYAIAVDDSGNVYVTGQSGDFWCTDYATVKYGASGNELWVARYDGPAHGADLAYSVAVDEQGYVYVVGTTEVGGGWDDIATVKYDPEGREAWVVRYDGPMGQNDRCVGPIRLDAEGCAYIAGTTTRNETGGDWVIIKYKPEGQQEWITWHTGLGVASDHPNDMLVSASGEVWVTGAVRSDTTAKDITTVKYSSLGEEVWVAAYDGPASSKDIGRRVALDSHGTVWVAGTSTGIGGDYDWVTIHYDSTGQQVAAARYDGPGCDTDAPYGLAVDDAGSAYVAGMTTVIENDTDIATIKYSVVAGVLEHSLATRPTCLVAPNPFQREATIEFVVPTGSVPARLGIYNVHGQLVKRLVDIAESGTRSASWDATDMQGTPVSSGVYFVRLETPLAQHTSKLVHLR